MTCKRLKGEYVKVEIGDLFRWTVEFQSCGEKRNIDWMGKVLDCSTLLRKFAKVNGGILGPKSTIIKKDYSISRNRPVSVPQLWRGNRPLSWGGSCEVPPCLSEDNYCLLL